MKNKIKANFFREQIRQINDFRENDMIDDDVHIIYYVMTNEDATCLMHGNVYETMTMVMDMLKALYKESPKVCLNEVFEFIGKAVEGKL